MLPKMRYRLALDLGSTSIGWCLIRLNSQQEPIAIIRMGVRIFSDGRNPKDGTSLAVTRRNARQMRRRRDRLLKRKQRMLEILTKLGFFPEDENLRRNLVNLDPYILRKKGLYEPLTGPEFARALFHINQRRGFKSNRKTDKKDNDSGALKKAIKDLREKLSQAQCQTLGEWLADRHERGESVRARLRGKTQKDKAYDFYVDRAMIEHEVDTLWAKQNNFNPLLFNNTTRDELKDVLLHQRDLKPVKPGRCTLLPDEERAPLALPSTQRFRIYQEVNNLRILDSEMREQALSKEQRDQIAALLEQQRQVTFTAIRKKLKLSATVTFNLQDVKRDFLKGNITSAILANDNALGNHWYDLPKSLQDKCVELLLNEPSEEKLIEWLISHTTADEATARRIANINLPEGYGSLSAVALQKILPELMKDVITYAEAVKRAGFVSHSILSHAEATGEIMETLPYYAIPLRRHVAFAKDNPRNNEERHGKIANPTVHIGLNELRKVVNALIKRYGHPSEIIVEVAKDLKVSKKLRDEIQKEQSENQKRNLLWLEDACRVLQTNPEHLDKSKRRELIQKMQLWHELNPKNNLERCCPYTGERIGIERLLSSEVEIEHILPYSKTLDDSLNNKTVSLRRANRDKGNQTPYEAFGRQAIPGYDYHDILQRATLMHREKAKRFAPDGYQRWLKEDKDFLARALTDTAYLSRIAKEYLALICPPNKVRAIPGRMTALLRGKFGLNQMLSGNEHKNRNDHRHHALDAAVIGVTDQGLLQRFAKASASAKERHLDRLVEEMPLPWPNYREHVERALSHIIVSHKPDHGFEGSMFKETAYGIKPDGSIIQKKKEDAEKDRSVKYIVPIYEPNQAARHGTATTGGPRPYKGYAPDGNYCLEIVENETGNWEMETIPVFKAYRLARNIGYGKIYQAQVLQQMINTKLSEIPGNLIMKLMPGDIIRLNYKGTKNQLLCVVKMSVDGGATFTNLSEANISGRYEARRKARNRIKKEGKTIDQLDAIEQTALKDVFVLSQIGVTELKMGKARKITVSPIGELHDSGFKG
ncbi:MAG: type II CRISPR RNA-guided endonuclease Cas9 [Gammaproteobacteria bacterium]|nr:type II CRISPR RNA-guided endonuclease Cas9 [Gammaproteobacteria bacterium]